MHKAANNNMDAFIKGYDYKIIYCSFTGGGKPGLPRLLLSRKKREGFFDLSNVPRMMAHMARGLDYGLGSMIHSMMHAGHQ